MQFDKGNMVVKKKSCFDAQSSQKQQKLATMGLEPMRISAPGYSSL
jgi:hypothetical protein